MRLHHAFHMEQSACQLKVISLHPVVEDSFSVLICWKFPVNGDFDIKLAVCNRANQTVAQRLL